MGVPQTIVPGGGQPELEVIGGARPDSFPLLDGARGLAALCVFCFHGWLVLRYSHMDQWAARAGETPMRGITSVIGASGPEAVAVFFSLSGFLLYRPFLAARMAGAQSPRIGRFAVRRTGSRLWSWGYSAGELVFSPFMASGTISYSGRSIRAKARHGTTRLNPHGLSALRSASIYSYLSGPCLLRGLPGDGPTQFALKCSSPSG